ncbi:MAG: tellurite resistance TerB family protein [Variibacter sp.]|nr:tellurite resistance TerB family protein [Variibacter sp.]
MVIAASADAKVSDRELEIISRLVNRAPVFENFDHSDLGMVAAQAIDLIKDSSNLEKVLDLVLGSVPTRLHDTAYALAVEVATVDLKLEQEELRFLEMIRDHLVLDGLVSAAIETSARVRLRRAE